LFETFTLLRHVQIERNMKVTLAYKGLNCWGCHKILVWKHSTDATCSDRMLPESNTGLQWLNVL